MTSTSTETARITPFRLDIPQSQLDDLATQARPHAVADRDIRSRLEPRCAG
jgi:hypothetical protein